MTFQVSRRGESGERWLAEIVPAVDLALSDDLCARADRGEPLYLDLLHALLVKEGATIADALADPAPTLEHSALAEAFRRRPFDVRDPAARETALRLVAHEVEGEAVGYRAAVAFLARRGLWPETLRDAAGREPDYWLRTMMTVLGEPTRLHAADAGEGTDREVSFKSRLFELEATERSNAPHTMNRLAPLTNQSSSVTHGAVGTDLRSGTSATRRTPSAHRA